MSDEPVEACPPSATYKLRKFARRNRAALTTAAVVLFTVVAGLTVSTILIAREQGRTADALAEAQANLQTAQEQHERAEANFQKARQALDKMLTQVADELRDLPGLREQPDSPEIEKIKQALLEDALEFYQGFLEERSTEFSIWKGIGAGCHEQSDEDHVQCQFFEARPKKLLVITC
ncbi:MAG: hypothetical protein O7D91_19575 [Planctomycetota bacterium]|nr:hypothetical protein [Planctomycetota bacterium]